jgi:hypothetical protein
MRYQGEAPFYRTMWNLVPKSFRVKALLLRTSHLYYSNQKLICGAEIE